MDESWIEWMLKKLIWFCFSALFSALANRLTRGMSTTRKHTLYIMAGFLLFIPVFVAVIVQMESENKINISKKTIIFVKYNGKRSKHMKTQLLDPNYKIMKAYLIAQNYPIKKAKLLRTPEYHLCVVLELRKNKIDKDLELEGLSKEPIWFLIEIYKSEIKLQYSNDVRKNNIVSRKRKSISIIDDKGNGTLKDIFEAIEEYSPDKTSYALGFTKHVFDVVVKDNQYDKTCTRLQKLTILSNRLQYAVHRSLAKPKRSQSETSVEVSDPVELQL